LWPCSISAPRTVIRVGPDGAVPQVCQGSKTEVSGLARHVRFTLTSGHSIPAHYANAPKSDRNVELLDAIRRICASVASGAIRFPLNGSAFSEEKKLSIAAPP
jgi:hypothetical protein